MKKLITICSVMVLFETGYAMAGWTTIDMPVANGPICEGSNGSYIESSLWDIDGCKIVGDYYKQCVYPWTPDGCQGVYNYQGYFLYDGTSWTDCEQCDWVCLCQCVSGNVTGISGSNMVGFYYSTSGDAHGFLDNGIRTTFDAPGATNTWAQGIDGSNIVGYYYDGVYEHGFLYNGTSWTTIDMPGAMRTYPDDIDGSNIVGYYYDANSYMDEHGFLYNGTIWTTLDAPGAQETYPTGIDGKNIVGYYYGADGHGHGFLYNGTSWATLDAPEVLEGPGGPGSGTYPQGIDGSNIVGSYDGGSGSHGFIYTVPELTTELTKVDNVNDGDCVEPGREINYRIGYNYPSGPDCPDINNVNIVDYLPPEVDFNSASTGGVYDSISRTVTWHIGTLEPNDFGSVTLKVNVKPCVQPCSTITNECEIKSGNYVLDTAYEHTPVCCPTLTKIDNITGCVSHDDYITYNICYNAHGYPDSNVIITDFLPDEVEFVSASGNWSRDSNTVTWYIGTLEPNESGCVTLTVKAMCVEPGNTIINQCKMTGDCIGNITAYEYTPVCSNYTLIDAFEFYTATGTQDLENLPYSLTPDGLRLLRRTWIDGLWTIEWYSYPNPTTDIATSGSYVQLNTDPCDGNLAFSNKGNIAQGGTKSMKFYYDNDGTINWVNDLRLPIGFYEMYGPWWNYTTPNYYSEASAAVYDAARLNAPNIHVPSEPFDPNNQDSLGMSRNWSGYKLLKLSYYGDPNNTVVSTDKLYVGLKDGDGTLVTVTNSDPNIIKLAGWHNWYIRLKDFNTPPTGTPDMNLADVNRIYIGIGDRTSPVSGGKGAIFFDGIQLYPVSVCIPGSVVGDFTCDCIVNYDDLKIMRDEWLNDSIADIYFDGIVNFKDLALFANNWMVGPILFPN